jgi:hypothetical protein
MKPALLTLFILLGCRLSAQGIRACAQKLDTLTTIVSHDYAGYHDKVLAGDRNRYQQFVDSLRKVAATTVTAEACNTLLDTYCAYFKDKQLMIFRSPELLSKSNTVDPRPLTTAWTADSLRNYFVGRGNDLHELEGIWNFGTHELGLIYVDTADHYQAVTLRSPYPHWKEGMVKFTLVPAGIDSVQLDYWRADMTFMRFKGFYSAGHIALGEMGVLHRSIPATNKTLSDMAFELEHGHEVQWKVLEDSTLYIKLGTCRQRTKEVIDSLVQVNAAHLERLPEWIIDVRHNPGGTVAVFQALIPYLYTRTAEGPKWKYWLSPENIKSLKPKSDSKLRGENRTYARSRAKIIRYAEGHPNTWSTSWSSTFKFDRVRPHPRRIAILTDSQTAGRVEFFLIEAKVISERTIIVGQNTAGMVDYGIPVGRSLGPDHGTLVLPIGRMDWLGQGTSYNNAGIPPDIQVDPGDTDLIRYVKRYWASP